MLKTLKKSKKKSDIDDHLMHIVKNTTPYERLVWLKKNIDFLKILKGKQNKISARIK